ncbi:CNNM domain-containing protein [Microbacterium amylolyticum]|uniref:CBS domain containing-hemolysin-like protein n=1 Tax=Microbacterium amylolyticum TaxID=936337 RepID=A0ABS4ZEZ7_9MICO|nr:CNNM domain-containing protein [Microbacterium amylolyticum]MBP2435862.1 CBS domain containing-hemolysin-like protein [Microbacterium amylolyticum]
MNPWIVIVATIGLIAASAFFVVIEFSLLGARRHRLEQEAETRASARSALRGMNDLTLMLAVAQLGITACTFALGAVTKPAVDAWLLVPLETLGLPLRLADVVAFVLALFVVTFLHLVVGEMAPKSWAIAYPELAAKIIAFPARGLERLLRPLLLWINRMANKLVLATGVTPVERAAVGGQDIDTIRQLVEQSGRAGTIDANVHAQLAEILDVQRAQLVDLIRREIEPTRVEPDATVADVQDAAARTGHMRIVVAPRTSDSFAVVHVRDTLLRERSMGIAEITRPALSLDQSMSAGEAFRLMRDEHEQLAVVVDGEELVGVVSVTDILRHILPKVDRSRSATGE